MKTHAWMAGLLACAQVAWAEDSPWETVMRGAITVKTRSVNGSRVKELWAEGEIPAPVYDVQEALMQVDRLRFFMPYMKDAYQIGARLDDGSQHVYTLIDLPFVGKKDYVVRMELKESVGLDSQGTFHNEWHARPTLLPVFPGVTRIERNDGSWVVTPVGDGTKSWAVYRFIVDPGGWVPAFAINFGNQKGTRDTYEAVAQEAARRYRERMAAGASSAVNAQR